MNFPQLNKRIFRNHTLNNPQFLNQAITERVTYQYHHDADGPHYAQRIKEKRSLFPDAAFIK